MRKHRHCSGLSHVPARHAHARAVLVAALLPVLLPVLAAASFMSGCGGSSGGGTDVATPFVGLWTFDTGAVDATCTGGLPNTSFPIAGLAGNITKIDNSHIRFDASASCAVNFSVAGTTATAESGQSCTLATNLGPMQVDITSWTLTLSGSSMAASIMGTALGGTCTAAGTGTLTMHAPGDAGATD